ncbi:MAG: T9SS type A sorting domain-containing protein [Ignavibacteria bacterium]
MPGGRFHYRLKQVDYNGNFEFFNLQQAAEIASPNRFILNQNYPNPFNPETNINFELPVKSEVKIEIFDVSGRAVDKVIERNLEAGYHTVKYNGSRLSSGIYYCRMSAESDGVNFVKTTKMILIK